jgi:NADH:ubiquinone reductase (H+-translocating)
MPNPTQHIVIVGGGFAGVYTAKYLRRRLPAGWDVILFSQENHFIFTPLLGDVVGSSINPMHVVCPVRQMVPGVNCRTASLRSIDLAQRWIGYTTDAGRAERQPFDHLVLACGSVVNFDIIPGMAAHGWPLKTMGDALMLRNHLIGLLEKAEVENDPVRKRRLLSVVVVGGGYSGVEVAGEVADLLKESARFYSTFKPNDIRIALLEGRERILTELPESLSLFALKKMTKRGIEVRVKTFAQSVSNEGVRLQDGSEIDAATVICTIGTAVNPLLQTLGVPMVFNRIKTGPDMRVEGATNLWALGDCAAVPNAYDGKTSAPTAQVAVRQAKQLAANILRAVEGQPTKPFYFKPLGMLASIGNHKAVGLVFGLRVSGFLAWFIWRGIYLSKMPALGRKIQIAFDWAWQLIFPRDIVELTMNLAVMRAALQRSVQGNRSAAELLRMAQADPRLNTVRVREVMSQPVATLPIELTFAEALARSQQQGKGAYPVVDNRGRMVGICTGTDFYNAVHRLRQPHTPLAEIMHRPVLTVGEGESLTTALLMFLREPIKRLVVVGSDDTDKPVGMLTPFDVFQALAQSTPQSNNPREVGVQ